MTLKASILDFQNVCLGKTDFLQCRYEQATFY